MQARLVTNEAREEGCGGWEAGRGHRVWGGFGEGRGQQSTSRNGWRSNDQMTCTQGGGDPARSFVGASASALSPAACLTASSRVASAANDRTASPGAPRPEGAKMGSEVE